MNTSDPLGGAAPKTLQIWILADCSSSMADEKIETVNRTMEECLSELIEHQEENPFADLFLRCVAFNNNAFHHISELTPIKDVVWTPLRAEGLTAMGGAIQLVSEEMAPEKMGQRNAPPLLVLLSDGAPTDDFKGALDRFNRTAWGTPGRTVRVAIGIGAAADTDVLARFTGNVETVFSAQNHTQLRKLIRYATVTLSTHVSRGASVVDGGSLGSSLPPPPVVSASDSDDDETW